MFYLNMERGFFIYKWIVDKESKLGRMPSEVVMVWDYWYQPIEPRFKDFLLGWKTEQGRGVHVRMRDGHFPVIKINGQPNDG